MARWVVASKHDRQVSQRFDRYIDMITKTALVTGGTDGVGMSVVKALVDNNYDVYFIGSTKSKGQKLEGELKAIASSKVSFIQLDLSDVNAVKKFADSFSNQIGKLDLLFLSAGVLLPERLEGPEGIEKNFAIGYLSAFILSHALTSNLEKAVHPRIVMVSGAASIVMKERLDFNDLNNTQNYSAAKAAGHTVHAKTVLAEILSEQFLDKGIDVNAVHPGIVKSGLGRDAQWPLSWVLKALTAFTSGDSQAGVHACISESLNGDTGKYIIQNKIVPLKFNADYKGQLSDQTENILDSVLNEGV